MSFLEANLRALDPSHPGLVSRLRGLPETPDRGRWSPSRAGPVTVSRDGVTLVSTFDPVTEAVRAIPEDEDSDFFVFPGLGAGYLVEAAATQYPDLPLLIAEADPQWFREVLVHRDLTALWESPRVVPLVGSDQEIGEFLGALACRTVRTVVSRPWAARDPAWYQSVAAQVASAQARSRVNLATARRFRDLWHRNLLKNEAAASVHPVSALEQRWKGVPVVVAAAGPSLSDSFAWMETHRHRFVLVAVDTAWPALAAQGLVPEVLVVLDGQYANSRHVDRVPPPATLVVTEWTGPPRAFRLAPGRTYVAATSVPLLRPREEAVWGALGALPSGGSVATACWSLALHLGAREVAFAGLDLGYPRDQTHVPGSQFEEAVHRRSGRFRPAETLGLALRGLEGLSWRASLDGGRVLSDPRMDLFRDWLSAAVAARPEVRAVNLGRRGSVVPGLGPAPAGYGDDWLPRGPSVAVPGATLVRRPAPVVRPPFDALAAVLGAADFPSALDRAWSAARGYWGAEVWDRWAGRARATWDRFPSVRSRSALEEVVAETLEWAQFWDTP